MQQDLKHCSCKCSGITGSGAKIAFGGLKFADESAPTDNVVALPGRMALIDPAKSKVREVKQKIWNVCFFVISLYPGRFWSVL
jgi:hypothetical protein